MESTEYGVPSTEYRDCFEELLVHEPHRQGA